MPVVQAPPPAPAAPPPSAPKSVPPPALKVLLRPVREPAPLVHVAVDVDAPASADLAHWRLASGDVAHLANVAASDATGPLTVQLQALEAGAVGLACVRPPSGHLHVEYDILVDAEGTDNPLATVVRGGHFRGSGAALIALPESIEGTRMPVSVEIDRAPLEAERAASSLGVGASRKMETRPRSLLYASFSVGAQGDVVFDTLDGHDEASWVGFPSFDMRGAAVELAELRSAFANVLGAHDMLPDVPWTYLFEVSSARAPGAFTVTPRFNSVLVDIGASQPWGTPLRLALGQMLARRWIGDAIRFAPAGHPPELAWFDDGVALYLATRVLSRLELLPPKDWADVTVRELSELATSPYAGKDLATVASHVADDPAASTALAMRGALYATRESAIVRARTKGTGSFEGVLVALLARVRTPRTASMAPLTLAAWQEALVHEDPGALEAFDAIVNHGRPVTLPAGALGPCFRAGVGEYVAFDAGFDVEATRHDKDRKPVALRAHGPAANAGLTVDDVVRSIELKEGDASVPVKVTVVRAGKQRVVAYAPRGLHGRGQTWTRIPGVPDDRCGPAP
jgi:hypothetical protein